MILSSPYTRALQTAAILSRELNIDLQVEFDLREWQPDGGCSEGFIHFQKVLSEIEHVRQIGQSEWRIYKAKELVEKWLMQSSLTL